MLDPDSVIRRLELMNTEPNPHITWDEECYGSARSLVVFVGPSPGGQKPFNRWDRNTQCNGALWNQPFNEPLKWSPGFRASFRPLVQALLGQDYGTAGKLIAIANFDWIPNPRSQDVPVRYMWQGRPSVLHMVNIARPQLVIAMEAKAYMVLEIALISDQYNISSVTVGNFMLQISDVGQPRFHRGIQAFRAERGDHSLVVIRSMQHPAHIYDADYASRCGRAIRIAANQISANEPVNVPVG
jgi:hypothetical protein